MRNHPTGNHPTARAVSRSDTSARSASLAHRALAAWNRFFFTEGSNRTLCLVRLLFGAVFVLRNTLYGGFHNPGNMKFEVPRHLYESRKDYTLAGNHAPVWGFGWLPIPSFDQLQLLEAVVVVLGAFFALGLFTRVVGPLVALGFAYIFFLSQFHYWHHAQCLLLVLLVLGFSPCADHYSLDALIRRYREGRPPPPRMILPKRLLQLTVSLIYSLTCIVKLNAGWFTGDILRVFESDGSIRGMWADAILSVVPLQAMSLGTIFVEGLLAFGLWFRKTRTLTVVSGVGLHLGIDMLMQVRTFSLQMFVLYFLFREERDPASDADPS
ncbi:MAG: HTTM domain-containing protein [Nannocystaceae bacterium]